MKKNFKFLVVMLAVFPFFISCSDDDDDPTIGAATITFDQSEIVIKDGVLSEPITGSVSAPSGHEVESITIRAVYTDGNQTNNVVIAERKDLSEETGSNKGKYSFRFEQTTPGIQEHLNSLKSISVEAKVKNGGASTKEIAFKHETTPEAENLSDPEGFEWKRVGGADGTGLALFGLAWTSNTATAAIIKTDSDTKLVKLDADNWSNLKTVAQLKEAVNKGTDIEQYTGVSATDPSKTYNDVLAVDVKGEGVYYLIHVTNSTVVSNTSGTTITVIGQYKN